jgi:hypothetical protein
MDTTLSNTLGTAPQCGLDIEPEAHSNDAASSLVFERCTFSVHPSRVIFINFNNMTSGHPAAGITFLNCSTIGRLSPATGWGIDIVHTNAAVGPAGGYVRFIGGTYERHALAALKMQLVREATVDYLFKDMVFTGANFTNAGSNPPTLGSAIEVILSGTTDSKTSRVTFDNVRVVEAQHDRVLVQTSGIGSTSRLVAGTVYRQKIGKNEFTTQTVSTLPLLNVLPYTPAVENNVNVAGVVRPILRERL